MKNLIKSLEIFMKYFGQGDEETYAMKYPTHCEHDILMMVVADNEDVVSDEDKRLLDELGWDWNEEYDCWCSFHYGSC